MVAASMESAERRRDVVFTTELTKEGKWRITANELTLPGSSISTASKTIFSSMEQINFLKTAKDGSVIVALAGTTIVVGSLKSNEYGTIDKMKYEFHVFQSSDPISSLDIRVSERAYTPKSPGKNPKAKSYPILDVVVGDVKGVIYLHSDLLQNLARFNTIPGPHLIPQKLHWHRQEVRTVKFSTDGALSFRP
jgi:NET1-associated nuclear protein 1 (U3 small nucleolar RNA-associated protein 17)